MNAEQLSSIIGLALSLVFSFSPVLKDWYGTLDGYNKRRIMLVLTVVAGLIVVGLGCAGYVPNTSCDESGIIEMLFVIASAIAANQITYMITPKDRG